MAPRARGPRSTLSSARTRLPLPGSIARLTRCVAARASMRARLLPPTRAPLCLLAREMTLGELLGDLHDGLALVIDQVRTPDHALAWIDVEVGRQWSGELTPAPDNLAIGLHALLLDEEADGLATLEQSVLQ